MIIFQRMDELVEKRVSLLNHIAYYLANENIVELDEQGT